jgi:hypothetical protein
VKSAFFRFVEQHDKMWILSECIVNFNIYIFKLFMYVESSVFKLFLFKKSLRFFLGLNNSTFISGMTMFLVISIVLFFI